MCMEKRGFSKNRLSRSHFDIYRPGVESGISVIAILLGIVIGRKELQ